MKQVSIFAIPKNLPYEERLKRRQMLARLGFAWLVMMQVMMFAFPGYLRNDYIDSEILDTLDAAIIAMNWISLALTIPVLFYSASPVWSGLFQKQGSSWINMNWPVALGIVVAFIPSTITTWTHKGEVYFESISMFVAFLLTARYLEFTANQSAQFSQTKTEPLLEQARATLAQKADKVAFWFIIVQIALAIITALVWYLYIDQTHAVPVLVSLFVMSCPCAMAMAVPTAYSAAQAIFLNHSSLNHEQKEYVITKTVHCTNLNLYGSLVWHLLMTPLAMLGIVAPWLAAITMLISSLAVAWNAYHLYKKLSKDMTGELAVTQVVM
ncbi:hypothetical protein F9B74_05990 [Pelistega sp. NLN82]|uniref:Uncharacterized protein n=1 Tax=Pelistega ratti TaxID=2652177 RepID=A0A6L9Y6G2_9BURK|nr:hypothetical protein [Pelistega ratti]NEN75876.1 hypothetical protein [Pelistega ratti]